MTSTRETDPRSRAPYLDEFDLEREIDFGRYWRALVQRWWLLLIGLVVGALVGIAASIGGSRPFESKTIVYMGAPFAPGGTNPIQSLSTRLTFVDQLLHSKAWTREVGAQLGLKPADLSKNTSTENTGGTAPNGKTQLIVPLIAVKVKDPSARRANAASTAFSRKIVTFFSSYTGTKLRVYLYRQKQITKKEAIAQAKLDHLTAQYDKIQNDPKIPALEKYFLSTSIYNQQTRQDQRLSSLDQSAQALTEVIVLARDVEIPRILEPADATRVSGPSKRTGAVVGAIIGVLIGILAALLWEPIARRVRRPAP
jgi:hypothetical protein